MDDLAEKESAVNPKKLSGFFFLIPVTVCSLQVLVGCGGGSPNIQPAPPPLVITSAAPPAGSVGSEYDGNSGFSLHASGGAAPYKWSWAPASDSSLPSGLVLSNSSIAGTPTTAGSYSVIVQVTDAQSPPAEANSDYSIDIDSPPAPLRINSGEPPSGTVGVGYGPIITVNYKCFWSPILGWHEICNPCDPSVAGSCPTTRCRTISPEPCLRTLQVANGFTFMASGGTPPYTWTATGLPSGLSLDPSNGNLAGTPTNAESYSIGVTVTDSQPTPTEASATYLIDISQ
jgi:hypothetical protein